MQQRPRPSRALVRFGPGILLVAVAGGVVVAGCEKTRALAGPGGDCDLAIDCLPGLVCLDDPTGRRVCSSDLTGVQGKLPPDGGGPVATPDGGADGAPGPAPSDASVPPPPPQDSGGPPPPQDAAANG